MAEHVLADPSGDSDHLLAAAVEHLVFALAGATGRPNLRLLYYRQLKRDHDGDD